MLRDRRNGYKQDLCWQNRVQEINDEAQPERENEPRNINSQKFEQQKYREIP